MQIRNYQKELEAIIAENQRAGVVPSLLLHSCCAPCSSYVLSYLSQFFRITVCYYNPNISAPEEFEKRAKEQARLIAQLPGAYPIDIVLPEHRPEEFYERVRGLEQEPEGGKRCAECFRLRLQYAGELAAREHFDWFTTTLSISPLKNAPLLNQIGEEVSNEVGVRYLPSDFKKKGGYQESIRLSKEYDLYRQDYCGCIYSKLESAAKRTNKV